MVSSPCRFNTSSVFGPTPHSRETGRGARKVREVPGGTTCWPLGLPKSEAIFATNFTSAMPEEAGRSTSRRISWRMRVEMASTVPNNPSEPVTSRKASSSERGSMSGV